MCATVHVCVVLCQVELGDLRVDSLVPAPLAGADVDVATYMARLPEVCTRLEL